MGDRVQLLGTNIVGDVRLVSRKPGCDRVTFKVTGVLDTSSESKTGRPLRGAWVTCGPDLLARRISDAVQPGVNVAESEFDQVLRAQIDRLVAEFEPRYSREQILKIVQESAEQYRDARITAFVPILVYREARLLLLGSRKVA